MFVVWRHNTAFIPYPNAMPQARVQSVTLGGSPDDVESSFYEALRLADIDRLMACWADEDDVVCVHPGGERLVGLGAIRAAFEAAFAAQMGLQIRVVQKHAVLALASAVHSVVERIQVQTPQGVHEGHVIATNVYHKTAQGWRLVLHHASVGPALDLTEVPPSHAHLH